jgi:hypothetical protein
MSARRGSICRARGAGELRGDADRGGEGGGSTVKYWVKIPVQVARYQGDLGDNIDMVVQELVKLDACNNELLDFSADSDATDDTAAFAVTVEADRLEQALAVGTSIIRSAIHATGAATPNWDEADAYDDVVIYQLDTDESVEVRQLVNS